MLDGLNCEMDRRSWLWRRKSSEKSPGETESSGSVGSASSHSERFSDDQEVLRASPNCSPNHARSPEVSSSSSVNEDNETVKSLNEKLSAALLSISAKEDLVKQHAKVAEEAVSGWEKAENEVIVLKQHLEAAAQKNSMLEDRISHLDEALKECVRQLRQSREEQEQKVHDAIIKKTNEWESNKVELENQLIEVKAQLEAAKAEAATSIDNDLRLKLEATEKENAALRGELLSRLEELKLRTLEKELCNQAAETASKQHLESIKKVTKLEAECRRLQAKARRLSANDQKIISNSVCVESLTDSQSDSGEKLLAVDVEPSCSDSWASALIAELDQFKNEKVGARNVTTSSIEIDLMDDFLEMERLAALPDADHGSSSYGIEADTDQVAMRDDPSKAELEVVRQRMAELEEEVAKLQSEKAKLEMALADTQNQLETSCDQFTLAGDKLVKLQKELESINEAKQAAMVEVASLETKRKALESELESALFEVGNLHEKVAVLEGRIEECGLSAELLKDLETSRKALESQHHSALLEVNNLRGKVSLLEGKIEEERALSAGFAAKAEALEAMRKDLESQLLSANLEAKKLHEKVALLEREIEEERSVSTEFTAKLKVLGADRKALEVQLESARSEVDKLSDRVALLEQDVQSEKALSVQFAAKCRNLESELSKKRQEAELRRVSSSNGELKIKQEKELAMAAGKLAECQRTIAALGLQLKSLTTLNDFIPEAEKPEPNGSSPDASGGDSKTYHSTDSSEETGSCVLPNGKGRRSPPSPSSSSSSLNLSGFTRLLSQTRSSSGVEN